MFYLFTAQFSTCSEIATAALTRGQSQLRDILVAYWNHREDSIFVNVERSGKRYCKTMCLSSKFLLCIRATLDTVSAPKISVSQYLSMSKTQSNNRDIFANQQINMEKDRLIIIRVTYETFCRYEHIISHCNFGVVWGCFSTELHWDYSSSFIRNCWGNCPWPDLPSFCHKCRICSGISLHSLKGLKCQ